jgi:hypothetical protein
MIITPHDVINAQARISDDPGAHTTTIHSAPLSARVGVDIWLP